MRKGQAVLLVLAAIASVEPAQAQEGAPPAQATMRAVGSPLRDGALPPGVLTVRVVRGGFSNNLPNIDVQADVTGAGTERAATGADGRAEFAHLSIGSRVRVTATVGGEQLSSDTFEMPAESGVRILLVAGSDEPGASDGLVAQGTAPTVPVGTIAPPAPPTTGLEPSIAVVSEGANGETPAGVVAVRAVLASATVAAIVLMLFTRRASRRRTDFPAR